MNFTILWVCLITIIGFILRIVGIAKSGGLWNDEYVSWAIASIPFGKGFIQGVFSQCHMPFYYLYLKFFMLLGNNDIYLRITSVIPAIISIPVMYLVGRQKSKHIGLLCATFTAISSFLIYYSQEVRFYSLLFLFSAFSLLFTLKIVFKPNLRNLICYIIFNALILFTHTIGFIYVFFNILYVSIKLYKKYNKYILSTWISLFIVFIICSPLMFKIFTTVSYSQWWARFNFSKLCQLIVDFFTPIIANVSLIENINGIDFKTILLVLPAIIAIVVIISGIVDKDYRKANETIYIALSTLLILIIAGISGKFVFESKYAIEIYPIFILIFCTTVDLYDKNWLKFFILFIVFGAQLAYIPSQNYVSFLPREEGHKYVADLIKSAKLKKDDYIVLTYYPKERFEKYQDFSKFNVISIHKGNFNEYFAPTMSYKNAVKYGREKYRGTFLNATMPIGIFTGSKLIYYINDNIYKNLKTGQKVAFIFLDSVSFLDETTFAQIVSNPKSYKISPMPFLIFSDVRNEIIKTIPLKAKNIRYEVNGSWTLVSFEK